MKAMELVKLFDGTGCPLSPRMAYYILSGTKKPSYKRAKILERLTGIAVEAWLDDDKVNPHIKGRPKP